MADHYEIAQIVSVIAVAYPNWPVTEETNEIYFQLLGDIPGEELKAAVLHCLTEAGRKFAPSVGEIRGAVAELRGMAGNVPSPFRAWQEVLEQFRLTGSYGTPQFSHPLITQAVRQMGWRELCMSENQIADRARFLQCYEQILSRAAKEDMLLPEVRGYIESNGAQLMAPAESMRLLADRLSGKK